MNGPPTDLPPRRRNLLILGWLLLALAVLRIVWVVGHQPLAGYGNQYDMARTSACIGWWPAVEQDPYAATHSAPIPLYRPGARDPAVCQWSVDALIAKAAFALAKVTGSNVDGAISLRWVGGSKAALWLLVLVLVQWQLSRRPELAFGHALFVALVLADPINTLWLNTLYTESAALLGAYLALSGLLVGMVTSSDRRLWAGLMAIGMLVLGLSRLPHLLLPLAMALLAWWLLPRSHRRATGILVLLGIGIAGAQAARPISDGVRAINQTNLVLSTLLPAASNPDRLLARMNLSPDCAELTRLSHYNARGRDIAAECPGLGTISSVRLLSTVLREPSLGARLIARSLYQSTAWRMAYLGELAGRANARVEPGYWGAGASLADAVGWLPYTGYLWLVLLLVVAGLVTIAVQQRSHGPGGADRSPLDVLAVAAMVIIVLVAAVSVFGDGFSELPRHLHLAINGVLLGAFVLIWKLALVFGRCFRLAGGVSSPTPSWLRVGLASLLPILLTVPLVMLLARQAQATGAVEIPYQQGFSPQDHRLIRGWVKDPFEIARVEAIVGGRRIPLALNPTDELDAHFPIDHRHPAVSFSLALKGDESGWVDFVVTNRRGIETLFDRRELQPAW